MWGTIRSKKNEHRGRPRLATKTKFLMTVVDEKLRKIIAVQEAHARKIAKENKRFRTRFAELYKKTTG